MPRSAVLPNVNSSDIRFMETNFTRPNFRDFMVEVYHKYKAAAGLPTLKEMKDGGLQQSQADRAMRCFFAGMK